ncbi:MAG: glycosyltransferase family 2 protein [Gemmatimonadaceae bacterium]
MTSTAPPPLARNDRSQESQSSLSTLSIVIPAYNEEDGIASIIERTLAARQSISTAANLAAVDVIVVSDGSTDRTAEIAGRYDDVRLIAYPKNRGYGAAIKTGFSDASGDILAFLDADGTCDPEFFGPLCRALAENGADVAIGARLGPESEMPRVRRIGNRLYAGLLTTCGAQSVTDSASGMRVIRRSALQRLYPLPDGMHFTPAMSSIALFDPMLTIVEIPMRYAERVGDSKLSVARDGVRFLKVITETALSYRPLRIFGGAALVLLALAVAYGWGPLVHYLQVRRIEDWMYYRLSAVAVAITAGVTLLVVGMLAQQAVSLIHKDFDRVERRHRVVDALVLQRLMLWGVLAAGAGVALNLPALHSYLTTGRVTAHWIYILVGGLLVLLGIQCVAFGVLARTLRILTFRERFVPESSRANDR